LLNVVMIMVIVLVYRLVTLMDASLLVLKQVRERPDEAGLWEAPRSLLL
jgi:hypothetical protein